MDLGGNEYASLVSLLNDVDSAITTNAQPTYVDINETFNSGALQETNNRYPKLLELIWSMENELPQSKKRMYQITQAAQPVQPPPQLSIMPEQAPLPQPSYPQEGNAPTQQGSQIPATGYMQKEKESVAKELSALLAEVKNIVPKQKKAEETQPQISVKKEDNAILPGLPITEQISELEKIEEGLRAQVFSAEQIQIIKSETEALNSAHSRKQTGTSEPDNLKALRDIKLAYVMQLLK
jgi:hypothetical protein